MLYVTTFTVTGRFKSIRAVEDITATIPTAYDAVFSGEGRLSMLYIRPCTWGAYHMILADLGDSWAGTNDAAPLEDVLRLITTMGVCK